MHSTHKKLKGIISIGSDHAGYEYKTIIVSYLREQGYDVVDHGCHNIHSVDYPDFIHPVGKDIDDQRSVFGIVICGSGNGAAMVANKHLGVRCALCWNVELAQLSRQHNDANVISIPARFVTSEMAIEMIHAFLTSSFEGGRHQRRVEKINL